MEKKISEKLAAVGNGGDHYNRKADEVMQMFRGINSRLMEGYFDSKQNNKLQKKNFRSCLPTTSWI